jgi:tRNA (adenine57-N1/adenine58-N1)-methyltransferase
VLVVDSKDRRFLVTLKEGGQLHTHAGVTSHDALIGVTEGSTIRSNTGARYLVLRPTLAEFVLAMPRGAQVIYPKDLGQILIMADVFPGARVLEAGVGSGALSMALLRAGAIVTGYELRTDFANVARKNVSKFLGESFRSEGPSGAGPPYIVRDQDVYEGIDEPELDRIVLDLPEPWRVVKHAEQALVPGGILVAYLPTILQTMQLREALDTSAFGMETTVEVLQRSWHIKGQSVRPDHRMVAHTGFLTSARLLTPGGTESG